MTFEDFQRKTQKKTGFDKYWYYGLCIITIILSLVCFYFAFMYPEKFKGSVVFACLCFGFLLFLGSYGLYILPNRYKIVDIISYLPIETKRIIAEKVIKEIGAIEIVEPRQYIFFNLKTKWWQSNFEVHFFYDENRFSFSVQGHDFDGGFIDFGGTEQKRKGITKKINDLLL